MESVSSHRHHHQRKPGGGVIPCPEDVKRARKERGGWRGRRRGREGKGEGEDLNVGTDATQAHDEAEEPVSSYYFNLANLSSSGHARLSYTESSFQVPAPSSRNQNTICHLPFLLFVFTTLPVAPFLAVNAQTDRFIVGQATMTEAPISPSVLVPTPVFKSATDSVL